MLTSQAGILVYLLAIISLVYWARSQSWSETLFKYFPPIIWIYFLPMISTTLGITPESAELYSWVKSHLLPAALLLLLLSADLKTIMKLGPKALGTMLAGTIGIVLGGVVALAIFDSWLPPDAWQGLGALSGSWIDGSANMVGIGASVGVRDELFGVMIVVDNYSCHHLVQHGTFSKGTNVPDCYQQPGQYRWRGERTYRGFGVPEGAGPGRVAYGCVR